MVVDQVLSCFRSHDPAIPLTPVPEGPAPEAEAAAREGVQEAAETVAARFERYRGAGPIEGKKAPPNRRRTRSSSTYYKLYKVLYTICNTKICNTNCFCIHDK
jgi:hypothetical protein